MRNQPSKNASAFASSLLQVPGREPGAADRDLAGRARRDIVGPAASTTRTSAPAGTPTEPSRRGAGGSGFDVIWWPASVIPYASIIGTP